MFRILSFLILVFALGLGFAWLAERPGTLLVTFSGYQYEVTLMVAAAIVTALVAAVMILWWLVKSIWNSPYTISRYFRVRRRDRGYQALSTGLIAAGAGDADMARRKHRESVKMLSADQEPLLHLLEAQASLLEGDHAAARKKFETMLDDPEMKLIGLRGLYLEAERLGDRGVARHYAEQASAAAPQLSWAANAALESRMRDGDWDGALRLLDARKPIGAAEKEAAAKNRAVLLTAKAINLSHVDPLAAKNAAIEANRLDPGLVPAAVIAAKALFRQDDLRKGAKILEAAWKKEPHPEIADAYVHARHGDSAIDRLKRARKLAELRTNNADSSLVVARAALEAGEYRAAREAAEAAARLAPREAAFLLLADIEDADGGDQGKVREYLGRAVKAQPDPAWTADGIVSEKWAPFSPVTGRIGAFEWRVPVERIGQVIEQAPQVVDGPAPEPERVTPPAIIQRSEPAPARAEVVDAEIVPVPANDRYPPIQPPEPAAVPPAPAPETPAKAETPVEQKPQSAPPGPPAPTVATILEEPPVPPIPDDPGVDPDSAGEKEARRFRLF
ncbi:heme biosynthesis protein HemY [Mesorhizobium sp. J428]|uniref:heme biosynthesis protein HemY n=1 Tax=Mesorhizobium sp. J428 TaxID=2898440 RepID=UPI002151E123|nr:heme biosynthesis protein HemY [Mesorhizobium sp. J428]MCR5857033.1 heme biosynthesis protein HemY [Mesorhizobium sp. J428]